MSEDTFENSYEFGSVVGSPEVRNHKEETTRRRHSSFSLSPPLSYKDHGSHKGSSDYGQTKIPFGQRSPIPGFVRSFIKGETYTADYNSVPVRREHFRSMMNMLEKQQIIEMLCQSVIHEGRVAESPENIVRECISRFATFRRLLVRNISFHSTSEEVKNLLESRYGEIEEGTVVFDRQTNKSKGFAFMTFKSVASACDAILDSYDGQIELNNRHLILKFASDRGGSEEAGTGPCASYVAPATVGLQNQHSSLKKLFVYNLSPQTSSESLSKVFGTYGPMDECTVVVDTNTGQSKRYAFVTYISEDSAWKCLQEPSKTVDGQMTFTHLASEGPSAMKPLAARSGRNLHTPSSEHSTTAPRSPPDEEDGALVMSLLSVCLMEGAWKMDADKPE